jgi:hypothetical protein
VYTLRTIIDKAVRLQREENSLPKREHPGK